MVFQAIYPHCKVGLGQPELLKGEGPTGSKERKETDEKPGVPRPM